MPKVEKLLGQAKVVKGGELKGRKKPTRPNSSQYSKEEIENRHLDDVAYFMRKSRQEWGRAEWEDAARMLARGVESVRLMYVEDVSELTGIAREEVAASVDLARRLDEAKKNLSKFSHGLDDARKKRLGPEALKDRARRNNAIVNKALLDLFKSNDSAIRYPTNERKAKFVFERQKIGAIPTTYSLATLIRFAKSISAARKKSAT